VAMDEAIRLFEEKGEKYKVEIVKDIAAKGATSLTLYRHGEWVDFCLGPHGPSTGRIGVVKLLSVAGAYWRGDARNAMLQRIYGTAFFDKKQLDAHLAKLEEAKKRDHRRLGPQLGLFTFHEYAPGSPFWLPLGTLLYNVLEDAMRRLVVKNGYQEVKTPLLFNKRLWETSGHWGKYRENMFLTSAEDRDMAIKPMNCPGHAHLFASERHSYRELPIRYSEPGLLHRNEPSGTLHGLLRVRHFAQDDAHIFCAEEQVQDEVIGCLDFAFATLGLFGFDVQLELSTRPEQRIGSDEMWDRAEGKLRQALEAKGLEYELNEGDGAFYGPKIDFHVKDSLGRSWQLGTVQLDYSMPERFDLSYIDAEDNERRPVMIHRAAFGSYERFIGILIEHLAGRFPLWLAPVQAIVLPVSDRHLPYVAPLAQRMREGGIRVEVNERSESVARKIRDAELRKIPYMLIAGDDEQQAGTLAVREHYGGDLGSLSVSELIDRLGQEIIQRAAAHLDVEGA
jgi:threonyl-tRNA synthetase